ncbi:glycosyltransferase [Azospirillum sp. sgz302134]
MALPSVLLVDLCRRFGGADVRVLQTAQALRDAGRRYAVAVLDGSELHRTLLERGLEARPLKHARGDPRMLRDLGRIIRAEKVAVVDAHNPQSQLWGALAGRLAGERSVLCTVHSVYRAAHGGAGRGRLHETALHLNRALGSRFVAVSGVVRDYLLSLGVPGDRVALSPNGIDTAPQPATPAGLRAALGWGGEAFVMVLVGRLDPIKGHRVLFQALHNLRERHPRLRCLVVGEGPERAALEAEVARLSLQERVHFTGFRTDVPAILAEADLFCLPSLSEGLPYAALEAARVGVPMLLSKVGGLAESFADGRDAVMAAPGQPAALAAALDRCVSRPEQLAPLAEAARRTVRDRFGLARMTADTLARYDALAPRRPMPAVLGADATL